MDRAAILLGALAAAAAVGAGCWVTPAKLTSELNNFDGYLKKREARVESDLEDRLAAMQRDLAAMRGTVAEADARVKALQADVADLREKMGLALEATKGVLELQQKVERALDEVYSIENRLRRNYDHVSGQVEETRQKYREVLLEEKRVLMERLRALNESLRTLGEGKEEGAGGD